MIKHYALACYHQTQVTKSASSMQYFGCGNYFLLTLVTKTVELQFDRCLSAVFSLVLSSLLLVISVNSHQVKDRNVMIGDDFCYCGAFLNPPLQMGIKYTIHFPCTSQGYLHIPSLEAERVR